MAKKKKIAVTCCHPRVVDANMRSELGTTSMKRHVTISLPYIDFDVEHSFLGRERYYIDHDKIAWPTNSKPVVILQNGPCFSAMTMTSKYAT